MLCGCGEGVVAVVVVRGMMYDRHVHGNPENKAKQRAITSD